MSQIQANYFLYYSSVTFRWVWSCQVCHFSACSPFLCNCELLGSCCLRPSEQLNDWADHCSNSRLLDSQSAACYDWHDWVKNKERSQIESSKCREVASPPLTDLTLHGINTLFSIQLLIWPFEMFLNLFHSCFFHNWGNSNQLTIKGFGVSVTLNCPTVSVNRPSGCVTGNYAVTTWLTYESSRLGSYHLLHDFLFLDGYRSGEETF